MKCATSGILPVSRHEQNEVDDLKKSTSRLKSMNQKRSDNPFVNNTIVIWYEAHTYLRDLPVLSRFSPIWGNDHFSPAKKDMGFKMWMNKGMIRIKDVYEDNILQSFESLVVKFHIPQKHLFKYLQLRSFITTCLKGSTQLPPLSILENCTLQDCYSKGWITQLCNILRSNQKDCSEVKRQAWIQDMNMDISEDDWNKICLNAQTQTLNSRLRLLQYNWVMRTYITPVRLNKCNPDIPDLCFKCGKLQGTCFHCVWECEEVQKLWIDVSNYVSQLTSSPIPLNPVLMCIEYVWRWMLSAH